MKAQHKKLTPEEIKKLKDDKQKKIDNKEIINKNGNS
jgi:hypothetical protein